MEVENDHFRDSTSSSGVPCFPFPWEEGCILHSMVAFPLWNVFSGYKIFRKTTQPPNQHAHLLAIMPLAWRWIMTHLFGADSLGVLAFGKCGGSFLIGNHGPKPYNPLRNPISQWIQDEHLLFFFKHLLAWTFGLLNMLRPNWYHPLSVA